MHDRTASDTLSPPRLDSRSRTRGRRKPRTSVVRWSPVLMLMMLAWIPACSFAPKALQVESVDSMPDSFDGTAADSIRHNVRWWDEYDDPVLEALIDSALARNLDLAVAVARVIEVQNQYRISRAALAPSVGLTVDGTRQEIPTNTGATRRISENIPNFPDRFDFTTYSASLGLSYELDFWGRVRSSRNAALSNYFASIEDLRMARLGVISETIATYFEISELTTQVELTRANVDLLKERTELTRDRYRRGLVTSFELYAIEQEFEDARAGLPLLESRLFDAEGRLAVLLGRYRRDVEYLLSDRGDGVRVDLDRIPPGLPSELLRTRPDVAAAEFRMEAARQRVGVARAERFPRFSLSGSSGTQSGTLDDLVDTSQRFWLFGGSLTAPIFNAGALRAAQKAAWAQYEQAAAAYQGAVLTAFKDVESALVALGKEGDRYRFLQQALSRAEASVETQRSRYVRGIGDYLAYIDARRNLIRVRSTVVAAESALAVARLSVHRALGGEWTTTE